jgi:hypothetical protein
MIYFFLPDSYHFNIHRNLSSAHLLHCTFQTSLAPCDITQELGAPSFGHFSCRVSILVDGGQVCAMAHKELCHICVPALHCPMQRPPVTRTPAIHICAPFQQQARGIQVAVPCSIVQGCAVPPAYKISHYSSTDNRFMMTTDFWDVLQCNFIDKKR